jgi:hypothetical protein
MRPVSDAQTRKLMEEMSKEGRVGDAAMDRKTASNCASPRPYGRGGADRRRQS